MTTFRSSVAMSRSRMCGWGLIAALIAIPASASGQPRQEDYTIHGTDIQLNVTIQLNAGELFDKCSFDAAAPGDDAFICAGFLAGVEDGMTIVWASNGLPRAFCPPMGTRRGILLARFIDYMRAHPERRTLPAALVILQAYREIWPCPAPGAP